MRIAALFLLASTAAHAEQIGLKCYIPSTFNTEWHILIDTDRQVYSARLERGEVFKDDQPVVLNAPNPPGSTKLNLHIEPNTFGFSKYWLIIKPDYTAYTSSMMGNFMREAGTCKAEKASEF